MAAVERRVDNPLGGQVAAQELELEKIESLAHKNRREMMAHDEDQDLSTEDAMSLAKKVAYASEPLQPTMAEFGQT